MLAAFCTHVELYKKTRSKKMKHGQYSRSKVKTKKRVYRPSTRPRQKHALTKRLDREKLMSPSRVLPLLPGQPTSKQELANGTGSPSTTPRAPAGQGSSPQSYTNMSRDKEKNSCQQ